MKKNYIKPATLVCNVNTDDLCVLSGSIGDAEERSNVIFDSNSRGSYYDEDDVDFEDIW